VVARGAVLDPELAGQRSRVNFDEVHRNVEAAADLSLDLPFDMPRRKLLSARQKAAFPRVRKVNI